MHTRDTNRWTWLLVGLVLAGAPAETLAGPPLPAARVGDPHVCPLVNAGIPPVPHVGGPVLPPGEPTVLICLLPAATVGTQALCVGPPDTVAIGSSSVRIAGKGAARITDLTAHGGVILTGCPLVLIGD